MLVGAGFGLGWSPCIGPILSTVLALAASKETALQGTALLAVYSAGLAVPFLLAGWSIEFFFRAFARIKQHFRALEVASGAILVAVGLLLVFNQFTRLNQSMVFLNDWIAALEEMLL
jgi:cytochrome c-type biogenesis protein